MTETETRSRHGNPKTSKSKKDRVWLKTDGRCVYCGCEVLYEDRTLDHLWPVILGGPNCIQNLLPACRSCNSLRQLYWPPSDLAHPRFKNFVQQMEAPWRVKAGKVMKLEPQRLTITQRSLRRLKAKQQNTTNENSNLTIRPETRSNL